jgi:DNA-binding NtrC family response regulator
MEVAIQALRRGAVDFLIKPIKLLELDAVLEKGLRVQELRKERRRLRATIGGIQAAEDRRRGGHSFIGKSAAARRVQEQIKEIVEEECDTVLITGETGTGKEVVARQIHSALGDGESPFIAVSCPALTDSLVESELFGHTKGSFTGANIDRSGYFELADGGTLFLDEVGDLSPSIQAVLLRVLETRSFRRIGADQEIRVRLRVIAATNVELQTAVDQGTFRRDLFYRLNVYPISLSPLRERRSDIIPLAHHFLATYADSRGKHCPEISPAARATLEQYDYPGNARELRNIIERAAMLCRCSDPIEEKHLGLAPLSLKKAPIFAENSRGERDERGRIVDALKSCRWNRRKAAEQLNMPYSTLRFKIDRFNINQD